MRILCLQHVPFETPGALLDWARSRRHAVDTVLLAPGVRLPRLRDIDLLLVMGGPMSVHDEQEHAWLRDEKSYLRRALALDKPVVGVCLGAQLIAEALGGTVMRNRYREIGWFPLVRATGLPPALHELLPGSLNAFHWHGETFSLPAGAIRLASSAGCENQVFIAGRALGLQCHLEVTPSIVGDLITHCGNELVSAPYVQTAPELVASAQRFGAAHRALARLLDGFLSLP